MLVLPTRITVTPSPCRTRARSGEEAPPCDTEIAVPLSLSGSTGVATVALPTFDRGGQLRGLASKVASGQALLSVARREVCCLGSVTTTDLMLAWEPAG